MELLRIPRVRTRSSPVADHDSDDDVPVDIAVRRPAAGDPCTVRQVPDARWVRREVEDEQEAEGGTGPGVVGGLGAVGTFQRLWGGVAELAFHLRVELCGAEADLDVGPSGGDVRYLDPDPAGEWPVAEPVGVVIL